MVRLELEADTVCGFGCDYGIGMEEDVVWTCGMVWVRDGDVVDVICGVVDDREGEE